MKQSSTRKLRVRVGLALRQNRVPLLFVVGWLALNFVIFARVLGFAWETALLTTLCAVKTEGTWATLYRSFTEVVVFGLVASVVITNITRKYRPEETCRALASESEDHVVIIGYTNLGQRVRALVLDANKHVVIVEEDRALIEALIREEDALVVGSGRDPKVLEDAAVARAKVVIIATEDLETAAVACRRVRKMNDTCELVVRCPDDDVGDVLAKTYRARPISTSKVAAKVILAHAAKQGTKKCVILGKNNVGKRVEGAMTAAGIACTLIDVTEDVATLAAAGVGKADMVVIADDDLGKNLIRVDRVRDLDSSVKIVCRVFHDDAAEMLTQRPFSCLVLSTSRHAAQQLVREGMFRSLGITG